MASMKGLLQRLMPSTVRGGSQTPPAADSQPPAATPWAKAYGEHLNRKVMQEHEDDLAMLPPEIRASRSPEEWAKTPPLEILKLVREARQG